MKSYLSILFIILCYNTFGQSDFSLITKIGGQFLQDVSGRKEIRAIGKAIETAGDMTYTMELVDAANNKNYIIVEDNTYRFDDTDLRIRETQRVYPKDGYKWVNPKNQSDFNIEPITTYDQQKLDDANDLLVRAVKYAEQGDLGKAKSLTTKSLSTARTFEGFLILSTLFIADHEYNLALKSLSSAIDFARSDEEFIMVFTFKGFCEALLGYNEKSLKSLEIADKNFKGNDKSLAELNRHARLVLYMNTEQFDKLLEVGRELGNPNLLDPLILYTLVGVSFVNEDYGETLKYSRIYIDRSIQSDIADIYLFRACSKIELGLTSSGCEDIIKSIELGVDRTAWLYKKYQKFCR